MNDPFLIARPADAKTSVSILELPKSEDNDDGSSINNTRYQDKINKTNHSLPVKVSSIYSKSYLQQTETQNSNLSTEHTEGNTTLPNSVDQIIDNL